MTTRKSNHLTETIERFVTPDYLLGVRLHDERMCDVEPASKERWGRVVVELRCPSGKEFSKAVRALHLLGARKFRCYVSGEWEPATCGGSDYTIEPSDFVEARLVHERSDTFRLEASPCGDFAFDPHDGGPALVCEAYPTGAAIVRIVAQMNHA